MTTDRTETGRGAEVPLPEPTNWQLEVLDAQLLTPNVRRVSLTGSNLGRLRYVAGQDLMLRVPRGNGDETNRRYTIRHFERARPAVTIDAALHGTGPGTNWFRSASTGDLIHAVGPRGKITPRPGADWHIFIADESGLPGSLAMMESLSPSVRVMAVFEIDGPDDEQTPDLIEPRRSELTWLQRRGRSTPGQVSTLRQAISDLDLPAGSGHAYIAAEAAVVRSIRQLLVDKGMGPEHVSAKAYWRLGIANADHGEPARD